MLIKDLADSEKPRERLLIHGKENISNEEVLAIILRTGTKDVSAKMLAQNILAKYKNIENLKEATISSLNTIKGMGTVKSIELIASIELGKRVFSSLPVKDIRYNNSSFIFESFKDLFKGAKQEMFYALYFDSKQRLIDYKLLFKGTLNNTTVHPREIFKEAFLLSASSIIIIHNHPSGDVTPSKPDCVVTENIQSVGKIVGLPLVDHIIIGIDKYYSFYEEKNGINKITCT